MLHPGALPAADDDVYSFLDVSHRLLDGESNAKNRKGKLKIGSRARLSLVDFV